jgi:hypothetical protein
VLANWFKHPAGMGIDPVRLRACDTLHRLIRPWIVSDRWIISPCLHLLASVGTAVNENSHDVRLTWLFVITFDLAQSCLSRRSFLRTVTLQ